MEEWIGYFALAASLLAMGRKNMLNLRLIHSVSALAYMLYGYLISAWPIVIGGSLFLVIHAFHIVKLVRAPNT